MASNAASSSGTGSQILDDLAEVIGEEATFTLAAEFRGETVYVPNAPDMEPRIADAIGEDLARRFCDAFWRTYIPFPTTVVIERMVIELAAQKEPRLTKREIARRLKIRQARVFEILARHREAQARSDQLSMF